MDFIVELRTMIVSGFPGSAFRVSGLGEQHEPETMWQRKLQGKAHFR